MLYWACVSRISKCVILTNINHYNHNKCKNTGNQLIFLYKNCSYAFSSYFQRSLALLIEHVYLARVHGN